MKGKRKICNLVLQLFGVACILFAAAGCDLKNLTLEMVLVGIVIWLGVVLISSVLRKVYAKFLYSLGNKYCCRKKIPQDYEKAFKYWKESAKLGNANAQYRVGCFYYINTIVSKNKALLLAVDWWMKSAKQNNKDAESALKELGNFDGVKDILKETICKKLNISFEESAESNSLYCLGKSYYYGISGNKQDYEKAFTFWERSAKLGNAEAQYEVGRCYYEGKGVPCNQIKSIEWWQKSAEQGNVKAQNCLGYFYYIFGNNFQLAEYWLKKSAGQKNVSAEYSLGSIYFILQKGAQAFIWWKRAANQGHAKAAYQIGRYYYYGLYGVKTNCHKAVTWWQKSAEKGNRMARYSLAYCYKNGKGVDKDEDIVPSWFSTMIGEDKYSIEEINALEEIENEFEINPFELKPKKKPENKKEKKPSRVLKKLLFAFAVLAVAVGIACVIYSKTKRSPEELCVLGYDCYYGYSVQQDWEGAEHEVWENI